MAANESEFGGTGVMRSGVHPPPHIPNAHEQLGLWYRTGDPSGQTPPDNGEIFAELGLSLDEISKLRDDGAVA